MPLVDNLISSISGDCNFGTFTTNGTLGFGSIVGDQIFSRRDFKDWHLVGAHASSYLKVKVERPVKVVGFLNASAFSNRINPVEFWIDNNFVGRCNVGCDETQVCKLRPGVHELDAVCRAGEVDGRHACWAITEDLENDDTIIESPFATSENVAVTSVAIYKKSELSEKLKILAMSAHKHNIYLNLLREEPAEQYPALKMSRRTQWFKNLPLKYKYILFVNGSDSVFSASLAEICIKYNAVGKSLIVGAENICRPEGGVTWAQKFPLQIGGRNWPNSGFFMGERNAVIAACEEIDALHEHLQSGTPKGLEKFWWLRPHSYLCERVLWHIAYLEGLFPFSLDIECQLCSNVTSEDTRIGFNSVFNMANGALKLKRSGIQPAVLQFPGVGQHYIQQWAAYFGLII